MLEKFDEKLSHSDYKFQPMSVWLHVIDPPLMVMTLQCARQIGNQVGRFLEWDKGTSNIVLGEKDAY